MDEEAWLKEQLARIEPRMRAAFERAVAHLNEQNPDEVLVSVATSANVGLVRGLEVAGALIAEQIHAIFIDAGREYAAHASQALGELVVFNTANWRALAAMRDLNLNLAAQLALDQKAALLDVLDAGLRGHQHPTLIARNLRQALGLTRAQIGHVLSYRRLLEQGDHRALDRQLRDARSDGRVRSGVITPDDVERMTDGYARRMLAVRAEAIARTEALRALHRANHEVVVQLVLDGVIDRGWVFRTWHTAGDERVRHSHAPMNGQVRHGLEEKFTTGLGNRLLYPCDHTAPALEVINCRCVQSIRLRPAGRL